jgi:putative colanic acid biosynthesis acetyltransferase WcaF
LSNRIQDLSQFQLPPNFRGRSKWAVHLWWFAQATFFRWSPQVAYKYRASLLRLFGAKVGVNTIIRPTVTITYPWKVNIGDRAWIGDDVTLYSLGEINIGHDTVISQKSYICAGDHDHTQVSFPIRARAVNIDHECWIAADCFVAPGVSIGWGSVIGARSSVFSNLPAISLCRGTPCRVEGQRIFDPNPKSHNY